MKTDGFYNGLKTPQKKNTYIPQIAYSYGVDKQAHQLAKLFYQSQKYFIQQCHYRSQLSFLYKSTYQFWCPLYIQQHQNLHRHFAQVLYALAKSLKVLNVIKGKKIIHNQLPKKDDIILCKYILQMRNNDIPPKCVWIPTKIISIDYLGNAEISFVNNYTKKNVFRKTVIQNSNYLKEWKWKNLQKNWERINFIR
jgi:hypothetical protein